MIVVEIIAEKHPGCWISETSQRFPNFNFHLFLNEITNHGYTVTVLMDPEKKEDLIKIPNIVSLISNNRMCDRFRVIPNSIQIDSIDVLYSFDIRDLGFTRGIIRAVEDDKGTRLPPFQKMYVKNGRETIYAVFQDNDAYIRVITRLGSVVGGLLISAKVLTYDASPLDVFNIIPSFFDKILPPDISKSIKILLGELAVGTIKIDEAKSKLERVKEIFEKYGWLIRLGIMSLFGYLSRK